MIPGIQIVGAVFCISFLFVTFMKYKKNILSKGEFYAWCGLWIVLFLVLLFPAPLESVLKPLAVVRLFDLVTALAAMFLFGLSFNNYLMQRKLKKNLEKLVRKSALQEK